MQAHKRKRAAVRALHRELVNRWPNLFDPVAPRPLAIGIGRAIRAALRAELSVSGVIVRLALAEHMRRRAYQAALAAPGATRHGLDGAPSGEVSQKHAGRARAWLARRDAPAAPPPP